MIRRSFSNAVFTAGVFFGSCIGIGIMHWLDGGSAVLSVALLAWSSIGIIVGDWAILGGRDHCQRQMDK